MTTERAQEFQMRITEEALALMIIHGESVSDAPSEEDISLAHYEEAVTLIGKAWGLPAEATAENLGLIQREKDVLRRIAAGENVNHILPEEELPYVKQKFYKGSSKARGSGIGLAVCDEIVKLHGGTFEIGNAEGGGAVVTIRLPAGE